MIYFVFTFLLLMYFEILGQAITNYLKKDLYIFSFGIGIISWLAIAYLSTGVLTALNISFYVVLFIYIAIFTLSIIFIVKNIREIKIDFINWIFLLLFSIIILYYSFNVSLGDLNGFDSTHYLNLVSGNIGLSELNTKSVVDGRYGLSLSYQYTFQSYYYLASCVLFIFGKICAVFNINFYSSIGFIWIFQTLYNFLFISIILIALNKFFPKKHLFHIIIISFFVLCYFRIYYNSAFGFYGNTYRTIIFSYTSLFLIEMFNNRDSGSTALFALSLLASCAVSSSGVFSVFFLLFALFFIFIDNNDSLFKDYAYILFVPSVNLLTVLKGNILLSIFISLIMCLILYFGNDILIKYIRIYKLKKYILIFSILSMFLLSYIVTKDIFNFDAFLYSSNEQFDMTLNYFREIVGYRAIRYYKFIVLFSMLIVLVFKYNDYMSKMTWILILVFFNPFCCSFLNEINVVYYRAYDLIINPFLLIWMFSCISELLDFKQAYYIVGLILFCALVSSENYRDILYWHGSFEPGGDYNYLYKMENGEVEIIQKLKENIEYYDIDEPYIITPNLRTLSMIPEGNYLFGREYRFDGEWPDARQELYKIFYPVLYWGDEGQPENPDYENMCEYINDDRVDFIVQPKSTEYYDKERNIWYSLTYKINECGEYPIYENDDYALYMYER